MSAEYFSALGLISEELIRRKALYPTWDSLREWLREKPAVLEVISHLTAQGHICRMSDRPGEPRFEFRHDRILEYHLARAAFELLRRGGPDRQHVGDPFFVLTWVIPSLDLAHQFSRWSGSRKTRPLLWLPRFPICPVISPCMRTALYKWLETG